MGQWPHVPLEQKIEIIPIPERMASRHAYTPHGCDLEKFCLVVPDVRSRDVSLRAWQFPSVTPEHDHRSNRRGEIGQTIVHLSRRTKTQKLSNCTWPESDRRKSAGGRSENAGRHLPDRQSQPAKQLSSTAAHLISF